MEFRVSMAHFEMIRKGEKCVEIRLNDEKRQALQVGDTLTFCCLGTNKTIETKVTRINHYKSFGFVITPVIAEAATTLEFDKYTEDLGSPILPLKFLFVVEMQLSPSLSTPMWPPRQGPQPGLQIIAPASMNVSIYPKCIAFL